MTTKHRTEVCEEARQRVSKMSRKERLTLSMKACLLRQDYLGASEYRCKISERHKI